MRPELVRIADEKHARIGSRFDIINQRHKSGLASMVYPMVRKLRQPTPAGQNFALKAKDIPFYPLLAPWML
jgi:hypothetical protein